MQTRPTPDANQISISDSAIRALVTSAVQSCYGIVGVGRGGKRWATALRSLNPSIEIRQREYAVIVRIPVIVEYGLPVVTVAENLIKTVTHQLQQALGGVQPQVEVQVIGLRQQQSTTLGSPV